MNQDTWGRVEELRRVFQILIEESLKCWYDWFDGMIVWWSKEPLQSEKAVRAYDLTNNWNGKVKSLRTWRWTQRTSKVLRHRIMKTLKWKPNALREVKFERHWALRYWCFS